MAPAILKKMLKRLKRPSKTPALDASSTVVQPKSANQQGPKYQYKKLRDPGEIRVVVLEPGGVDDVGKLRCTIEHVMLDRDTEFHALSYAWGDNITSNSVWVGDEEIAVTESLHVALRYVRQKKKKVRLWADGICINQYDDFEKNHQVTLMGKIYSMAQKTLVWLGEDPTNAAETAFQALDWVDEYLCKISEYYRDNDLPYHKVTITTAEFDILDKEMSSKLIYAVGPLFDCPWFLRLWVVQEAVLAKEGHIIFGTRQSTLTRLIKVLYAMNNLSLLTFSVGDPINGDAMTAFLSAICIIRTNLYTNDRNIIEGSIHESILDQMYKTRHNGCRDPKDKIYGLLGLHQNLGLTADYTLSNRDVFQLFAAWCLDTYPDLRLLSYATGMQKLDFDLPSWAPGPDMVHLAYTLLVADHFHASFAVRFPEEDIGSSFSVDTNNGLHLQAHVIDTIPAIVPYTLFWNALEVDKDTEGFSHVNTLILCHEMATNSDTDEYLIAVRYGNFCRAMTCELAGWGERAQPEYGEWYHDYYTYWKDHGQWAGNTTQPKDSATYNAIYCSLLQWGFFRRFTVTANDHFSWVHKHSQPGDKIVVINGARVPYVVRELPNGQYNLVGECWVQGMMEGEALQLPDFAWSEIVLV